jgi:hypothetical protein
LEHGFFGVAELRRGFGTAPRILIEDFSQPCQTCLTSSARFDMLHQRSVHVGA